MDGPNEIERVLDMAAAAAPEDAAWVGRLRRGATGEFLGTTANLLTIFAHDRLVRGLLAYDEFRGDHVLRGPPPPGQPGDAPSPGPYPRVWTDTDEILILTHIQREYAPRVTLMAVQQAMLVTSETARYHPVREWLDTLTWDGKPRLDRWLQACFDAPDTDLTRAMGARTLIGAARRVRQPGCKFDTILILEGRQNIGKSTAIRALCHNLDWFSDTIPPDIGGKEAMQSLSGAWLIEFAEIEHLLRSEPETIKAFLSRQTDRYRPPYGRRFIDQPRQCIFVGTTNATDYLRDETGNRRVWPVRCQSADPHWVVLNRDQLWAEAAHRERQGEAIWLDDENILAAATSAQEDRLAEDSWEHAVRDYILGRSFVRVDQILENALGFTKDKIQKGHEMRVGRILRGAGWERLLQRVDGAVTRGWQKPDVLVAP